MIYVISDLHGYPLKKFLKLLKKADFNKDDALYILGDVVDRNGDGGVEMLQWIMTQENVHMLLGHHEAMLLACEFTFDDNPDRKPDSTQLMILRHCYIDGAVTIHEMKKLQLKSPDKFEQVFGFLRNLPRYAEVTAGGKEYLLVHSGICNFEKDKKITEYAPNDFVWAQPKYEDEYFENITTVFGGRPTGSFGDEYRGKILKTKTWINIDVGAGYGEKPVLLRLDDMREFKADS